MDNLSRSLDWVENPPQKKHHPKSLLLAAILFNRGGFARLAGQTAVLAVKFSLPTLWPGKLGSHHSMALDFPENGLIVVQRSGFYRPILPLPCNATI